MKKRIRKKYVKAIVDFDRRNFGSVQYLMSCYNYDRWFCSRFYPDLVKKRKR